MDLYGGLIGATFCKFVTQSAIKDCAILNIHQGISLKEFRRSSASEEDKDYNRRFDPKSLALSIHTNPEGTKRIQVRDTTPGCKTQDEMTNAGDSDSHLFRDNL